MENALSLATKDSAVQNRPRIYVLYTGGTFGMAPAGDAPDASLAPLPLRDLEQALRDIGDEVRKADVTLDALETVLDSSSMQPKDWVTIAERIKSHYETYDGFVIIHGTDTLAYTASALGFIFENLAKPVVVTGSQLPLRSANSDAPANYRDALLVAAGQVEEPDTFRDVVVVFGERILRGVRARKLSASEPAAFDSPNCPRLGTVKRRGVQASMSDTAAGSDQRAPLSLNATLETGVVDLVLHPGFDPEYLHLLAESERVKGIVMRTFGSGNAPETPEFLAALKKLTGAGKAVVAITQCVHGNVSFGRYSASVGLNDCGVIPGHDLTPEAALTKLMFTLGQFCGDEVRQQMLANLRGELTAA